MNLGTRRILRFSFVKDVISESIAGKYISIPTSIIKGSRITATNTRS
jgi:hypothetical protein